MFNSVTFAVERISVLFACKGKEKFIVRSRMGKCKKRSKHSQPRHYMEAAHLFACTAGI
jgi:hypothetical protein